MRNLAIFGRGHGHGRLLKQRQHQTGSDQL